MIDDDPPFHGTFETHLTVRAGAALRLDEAAPLDASALPDSPMLLGEPALFGDLERWGSRHGWKTLHIVLARGATVSQPMLSRRSSGTLESEIAAAEAAAEALRRVGWDVVRVKLEVAGDHPDVPDADAAAEARADRYFEFHVKLSLPVGIDLAALTDTARRHGAHLSRNALRRPCEGREERFVTQRARLRGRPTALRRFEALVAELGDRGYEIVEIEDEYVVYDSAAALDAGWLVEQEVPYVSHS